eukprot:1151050-Pelagomonas_calceolata.AAC.2
MSASRCQPGYPPDVLVSAALEVSIHYPSMWIECFSERGTETFNFTQHVPSLAVCLSDGPDGSKPKAAHFALLHMQEKQAKGQTAVPCMRCQTGQTVHYLSWHRQRDQANFMSASTQ